MELQLGYGVQFSQKCLTTKGLVFRIFRAFPWLVMMYYMGSQFSKKCFTTIVFVFGIFRAFSWLVTISSWVLNSLKMFYTKSACFPYFSCLSVVSYDVVHGFSILYNMFYNKRACFSSLSVVSYDMGIAINILIDLWNTYVN